MPMISEASTPSRKAITKVGIMPGLSLVVAGKGNAY